tara:strand:- start:98 stop:760 length:663 start_codon:yes stop_codon:yes gene_type:complete
MRAIVLGAGQGYQLDGFNKLLIKDPLDGKNVIEKYIDIFGINNLTVVLGYRAINVMHNYPDINYCYNGDWGVTNNSHSLSLAISDEPCYVLSGDLFFDPKLIEQAELEGPDLVFTKKREARTLSAINVVSNDEGRVEEVYQGKVRGASDSEAIGIFKITSSEILKAWKQNCLQYPNLFIAQNLTFDLKHSLYEMDTKDMRVDEVNNPLDYIRLLETVRIH